MALKIVFLLPFIQATLGHTYDAVGSGLTAVPGDILNDTTMVYLDDNLIANISVDSFSHLRLLNLTVDGNKLTEFPNLTLHADTLVVLRLSRNLITSITSELLNGLYKLRTLCLDTNPLGTVPAVYITSLIQLNVQKCSLTEAPVFANPHNLKTLMLGYNDIAEIPDDYFLDMPILVQLNILNNMQLSKFIRLPNDQMSRLKKIYASRTSIAEVPAETMAMLDNLRQIVITWTKIRYLPPCPSDYSRLSVKINNNPLFDLCSAENAWLKLVLESGGTVTYDDVPCAGGKWSELTYQDIIDHMEAIAITNTHYVVERMDYFSALAGQLVKNAVSCGRACAETTGCHSFYFRSGHCVLGTTSEPTVAPSDGQPWKLYVKVQ